MRILGVRNWEKKFSGETQVPYVETCVGRYDTPIHLVHGMVKRGSELSRLLEGTEVTATNARAAIATRTFSL